MLIIVTIFSPYIFRFKPFELVWIEIILNIAILHYSFVQNHLKVISQFNTYI